MGRPSNHKAGDRFGMLTLKQKVRTKPGSSGGQKWAIMCDCGQRFTAPIFYLVRDAHPKRHCGKAIHKPEVNPYPREKGIWQMMHMRCEDSRHRFYCYYGGANPPITIDPRWHKSNPDGWKNFITDMGPAPSKKHTLDRINPFLRYGFLADGKINCRWATAKEQGNNMKRHWLEKGYVPPTGIVEELVAEEPTLEAEGSVDDQA